MRGRKSLNLSEQDRKERIKLQYREGQHRYYKTKYGFLKTKIRYYKNKFYHNEDFRKEFDLYTHETPEIENIEKLYEFVIDYNNRYKKQYKGFPSN